jgi:hypothetical protein
MRQVSPVLKISSSVGVTGLISARARETARTTIQRGEWRMVDELYERIVEESKKSSLLVEIGSEGRKQLWVKEWSRPGGLL